MCGFVAQIGQDRKEKDVRQGFSKIQYRGPDNSSVKRVSSDVLFMFHRLSIIGASSLGDQPLSIPENSNLSLICNGEIYNHKELAEKYGFKNHSGSDCEVILHLYNRFGLKKTLTLLDGVFAFVLHDKEADITLAARDPFGVRPAFIGRGKEDVYIASEAKALSDLCDNISPFPPGTWWGSDCPSAHVSYYTYNYSADKTYEEGPVLSGIRSRLVKAVEKRLMSEREIGCLLSGGLDSSLIASLVCKMNNGYRLIDNEWVFFPEKKSSSKIKTFSIGMSGSPDLYFAQKVADHIGSEHYEVLLTEQEFLSSIEDVIYKIESYDTTTVRASVGNYLVSKFIRENTDCKVIFNGDGSDEVCCGYVYNINAPSPEALHLESCKLIQDIHLFDVLRSDRSISSNGLEPRTPFLDKSFVEFYMSIMPEEKSFDKNNRIEKHLLRKAFSDDNLLPDDILWRHKCAFSDGVSNSKRSWHKTIKEFVDNKISDDAFFFESQEITHCKPLLKESLYYRRIYLKYFPNCLNLIPYFWMPNWTSVTDPSARELVSYQE